jgi:hypothetical protein
MKTENKTDSNWAYSPIFYLSSNYHDFMSMVLEVNNKT